VSCCGGGCGIGVRQFHLPEGPPVTEMPVTTLEAKYLFELYGSELEVGEIIRIWMPNGETKTVELEAKYSIEVFPAGPEVKGGKVSLPWQLIAIDSGIDYEELMDWYHHPLYQSNRLPVVLQFKHPVVAQPSLKMRWLSFLYKMRNLGQS